jgi:hypothetical protein
MDRIYEILLYILLAPLIGLWYMILVLGALVAPPLEAILKRIFGREPEQPPPDSISPFVVECGCGALFVIVCLIAAIAVIVAQFKGV